MPHRLCFILLIAAATLRCTPGGSERGESGDTWQAVVDTIGDTVVVRTTSGSVWGDTMVLEPELTIGVLEGADEYMLGDVQAIAISQAGEIYVLDRQVPVVRIYGPDGTYRRNLGRDGGGPGEYKNPRSLVIHPDGRVLVRDRGNGRINVYSSDGESLTNWRLPSGGTFGTSSPLKVDQAGNTYTLVLLETGTAPWDWKYGLAKYTPSGDHRDTLRAPTWDFEPLQVTAQRENSSSSDAVPFTPGVHWAFSPQGYFVGGLSTDYRIDLYRADQPVLRIERDWEPVPVLSAERDERERSIIANFQQEFGGWHWNGPSIPDTKPPFRNLMVDSEGRVWVMVSQPAYEFRSAADAREEADRTGRPQGRYREPAAFDLFSPDGRYLGALGVPREFSISPQPITRGDTVWAVTRDELDVPRVVRFRMVPAGEQGS